MHARLTDWAATQARDRADLELALEVVTMQRDMLAAELEELRARD